MCGILTFHNAIISYGVYVVNGYIHIIFKKIIYIFVHGRAELDAAGFIRAEENDKRTHIKKIRRKFYFL